MARSAAPALALWLALASTAHAAPGDDAPTHALRVEDAECVWEIAFEPDRIDEAALRRALRLRPGYVGSWLAELAAVTALPGIDPLDAVEAAVPRTEAVLARFDAETHRFPPPAELASVVAWTRADLEFQLWLARTTVEFCRNGDPATLARPYGELETPARCAEEVWLVDPSILGRCRDAILSWGTCVAAVVQARNGPFPENAWDAFLRTHGIHVHAVACSER